MTEDALSRTMAALANPTRRAILARLSLGEATVAELARPFDLTLPGISKHLKVLRAAGLITQRRRAQERPCSLALAPLQDVDRWMAQYRREWEGRLDRLEALFVETRSKEKEDGRRRTH